MEPARVPTTPFFAAAGDVGSGAYTARSQTPETPREQAQANDDDTRQHSHNTASASNLLATNTPAVDGPAASDSSDSHAQGAFSSSGGAPPADHIAAEKGSSLRRRRSSSPAATATNVATDQANTDRLCQAIADRVEVRSEGRGGRLALKTPRRRGEGGSAGGLSSGAGHKPLPGGDGGTGLRVREDKEGGDGDDEDGGSGGDSNGGLFGGDGGRRGSIGGMPGGDEALGLAGDEARNQEVTAIFSREGQYTRNTRQSFESGTSWRI